MEILDDWAVSGRPNLLLCVGRRSGKTMVSAGAAIMNAVDNRYLNMPDRFRSGEPREIVVVANSENQAGVFIGQVKSLLQSPRCDSRITAAVNWDRERQDLVSFVDNVSIRVTPLSSRSVRGPACSFLVFDECGHFQAGGQSVGEGNAVYQALAPTVAQFGPDGHIMLTSTPNIRLGLFWDQYRNAIAKPDEENYDPDLYMAQRATWEISTNPELTEEKLKRKFPGRPEYVATEYGADFMRTGGSFLDPDDVYACQRKGGTLPPVEGVRYACAIDPAYQRDFFTMAIAHRDDEAIVVDQIKAWSREGSDHVLDQIVAIAKTYGIRSIRTDQFASTPIEEALRKRGMACEVVPWANTRNRETSNKWDAYSRLKTRFATRTISIPNDPATARELIDLLADATKSGLVQIGAPPGGHDDRASVLAALMAMLDGNSNVLVMTTDYDPDGGDAAPDDYSADDEVNEFLAG